MLLNHPPFAKSSGLFKCRDCGQGVDDPTAHVCGPKLPSANVLGNKGTRTYSTYMPPPISNPHKQSNQDQAINNLTTATNNVSLKSSQRASQLLPNSFIATTLARNRGAVEISDIMVYKDIKSTVCTCCRELITRGQEVVCIRTNIMHTRCCVCKTCGLSVERDEYGSDGWLSEPGSIITCADCIAQREEPPTSNPLAQSNNLPPPVPQKNYTPTNNIAKSPSGPHSVVSTSLSSTSSGYSQQVPSKTCGTCRLYLNQNASIITHPKLQGSHHASCLNCQKCHQSIANTFNRTNPIHMRHGSPLCHPCYLATLPRCAACQLVINRDSRVCAALGKKYHPSCFACTKCKAHFPDKSFYVLKDLPYCRWCYHEENGSICGGCARPIEGACACVVEGRFHPKCFVCAACRVTLSDLYFSFESKPYCEIHIREIQRLRGSSAKTERRRTLYRNLDQAQVS